MGPILLLILLSQVTEPTFAQSTDLSCGPESELTQFCKDPFNYICMTPVEQNPAELDFEKMLKSTGIEEARELLRWYHRPLTLKQQFREFFIPTPEDYRIRAKQAKKLIHIANAATYNHTGVVPRIDPKIRATFAKAKQTMLEFVRKKYRTDTVKRVQAIKKLEDVDFYTPLDFEPTADRIFDPQTSTYVFEKNTTSTANPNAAGFLRDYAETCTGYDDSDKSAYGTLIGLQTPSHNAFYHPDGHYIAVCPGYYTSLILRGVNDETIGDFEVTIGHELAHSFFAVDPSPAVTACIRETFIAPYTDDKKEQQSMAEGITNEYVSDLYGNMVLLERLKSIQKATPDETLLARLHAARNAKRSLCYTMPGGGHPSGGFRIEYQFRRDPAVNAFFGCPVKTAEPQHMCTLNGRSKEAY